MRLVAIFFIMIVFFIGVFEVWDWCVLKIKKCFSKLPMIKKRKEAQKFMDDFYTKENIRENMRAAKSFRKDVDRYGWGK